MRLIGFIVALVLLSPLATQAQQGKKIHRIGLLEVVDAAANAANLEAFRQGLRHHGYTEGQNLVLEYRSADGHAERFPSLASELVRLKVDVIVTRGTPAALAAKHATTTIPIVMAASGDPIGTGIVASLARPGGNVTGLSAFATEVQGKLLELVKEVAPQTERVAFLFNMSNPVHQAQLKEAGAAARSMGLQVQVLDVRAARDVEPALDAVVKQRTGSVIVGIDAVAQAYRSQIVEALAKRRLPSISREREFADAGGLMSYGTHYPDSYRRAAAYVDKILNGSKPADLPIEQPTKLELIVNLKTARALRLTVPHSVLVRADEVIQ